ncbi:MAG: putative sulfate exporter family transporter [Gammaproteobacteria bacterium]|nr:putative sulfate exporter family transporter [Gammaproteobacteria bacterium]
MWIDRGKLALLIALGAALVAWASPPLALLAGMALALTVGNPFVHRTQGIAKWLLQASVVLLGFSMNLPLVLRLGLNGSVFAAITIGATMALGWWLGKRLALSPKTATLISVGTAICGGSAIAAVSTVIGASGAEIAVSIGTIFLLNAVALYVFPIAGHLLHLGQGQFGLWAGVAIHDISSVVGAGLSYGPKALQIATAVKLSRTLWIVPLTMVFAARGRDGRAGAAKKIAVPWFVGLFLLASLLRSYSPQVASWSPVLSVIAERGMILVLFLIGTALSRAALRAVGWRTAAAGVCLWLFISVGSIASIRFFHLGLS